MYTKETWNIAQTIATDSTLRDRVIALLQDMRKPTVYSNQRFDETQQLASFLQSMTQA
jgi:hypothetical protein